jgi:membrane protease YdiL (CAAX protease family)
VRGTREATHAPGDEEVLVEQADRQATEFEEAPTPFTPRVVRPPEEPEAGTVPPPEGRPWGLGATVALGAVVGAVSLAVQVLVAVAVFGIITWQRPELDSEAHIEVLVSVLGLMTFAGACLSAVPAVGLMWAFASFRPGYTAREYLALRVPRLRTFAGWAAGFAALVVPLLVLVSRFGPSPAAELLEWVWRTAYWPVLGWLTFVVAAPVTEELLFRGFLFRGIARSRLGPAGAVVLTSLAFAPLHLQYLSAEPPWGLPALGFVFAASVYLGVARWRTGSVWVPMVLHAGLNLAMTAQLAYRVQAG